MNKSNNYSYILLLVAIPLFIYFYFLRWKTMVMYGDDLYIFKDHFSYKGLLNYLNGSVSGGKYRPVCITAMYCIIELFQKNLDNYYIFNIVIQTINTFLFALILNRFLRSPFFSLFFSMIIGLSRFSFFNITQIYNGGALEGLAMTFFLATLYCIVKVVSEDITSKQKFRGVLWSIFFANLCLYTHERYIVVFVFIAILILFFKGFKTITSRQKISLVALAVASVAMNVVIKKYIYSVPFFTGTGGSTMTFSLPTAVSFAIDAVLSVFEINSGPEYLAGASYHTLPPNDKILVPLLALACIMVFIIYALWVYRSRKIKPEIKTHFIFLVFLKALFILLLVPAVATIRLEQRWLQAPLCVFILMLVIALSNLKFNNNKLRYSCYTIIILAFLYADYNYLSKGGSKLYMSYSEADARNFKEAMDKNVIHKKTTKLYIWEKHRDANNENGELWTLGGGYIFNFYENSNVTIAYVDSIYQRSASSTVSSFPDFSKDTVQIIYVSDKIVDITGDYLKDSLKTFTLSLGQ